VHVTMGGEKFSPPRLLIAIGVCALRPSDFIRRFSKPISTAGERDPAPGNVGALSATTALIVIALYTWYPVLPVVLQRRGADRLEVSAVYTLIGIAGSVLQIYGGQLADRFGRKPVLTLPTFVAAIIYFVAFLSASWQMLAVALVLLNLSGSVQSPSFVAITAESVLPKRRAQAFATFQFAASLATLVGPALGAIFLPHVDVRWLIGSTALASLVAAVVRQKALREVHATDSVARVPLRIREAFSGPLRGVTIASTAFLLVAALTVNGPFIALYAHNDGHLAASQVNLLYSLGWIPAVLLSFNLGRRISALGSSRALAIGVAGHLGLLGIWLLVRGFVPMVLIMMASFLFYQMALIAFGTLRIEMVAPEKAGAALGIIGTVSGLAAALGPVVAGGVADALGPLAAFGLAGAAGIWTLLSLRGMARR
jgi:DHA1 family bicyclomycin/chloramphenicol resistance-like MFS transporter